MNTPAHALVNLALLGRGDRHKWSLAILAGAVFPDLPILVFFVWEAVSGASQAHIWGTRYFDAGWQTCFDLAHSIPLALVVWVAARRSRPALALFAASVALHAACDLPLHHDDAHRHFLPLSGWRFASPVSYWDPRHHGGVAAFGELVAVAIATAVVWRRVGNAPPRARRTSVVVKLTLAAVLLLYVVAYAALYVRAVPPVALGRADTSGGAFSRSAA